MAEPMFPILNDPIIKAIPWAAIQSHEAQAQRNHSQSLRRLAQRGGLNAAEAVWVMLGRNLPIARINAAQMATYRAILMQEVMKFEHAKIVDTPTGEPTHDAR